MTLAQLSALFTAERAPKVPDEVGSIDDLLELQAMAGTARG